MIRFSARGAYLLLVPQGRALISLLRNNRMFKRNFNIYYIREKRTLTEAVTVTNTDGE